MSSIVGKNKAAETHEKYANFELTYSHEQSSHIQTHKPAVCICDYGDTCRHM